MANYVKSTDFASKDALITGNPLKIIKGTEINTEFNNIQTAIATKADLASPAFTGNPTATTQSTGNSSTRLATTEFVGTAVTNGLGTLGTISTQNANAVAITGGSISGLTSLTIPSTAIATTQAVGDSSLAVATTAFVNAEIANDISSTFSGANQSLGSSGFQVLPGGLILNWGSASVLNDATTTINFPKAYTTSVYNVQVSTNESLNMFSTGLLSWDNATLTTLRLNNGSNDVITMFYFAIGK